MKILEGKPKKELDEIYMILSMQEVLGSYQEVRKIYTMLDIKVSKSQKLKGNHKTEWVVQLNELWVLPEKDKRDEIREEGQAPFVREVFVHPDFLTVLAHDQQLLELEIIYTNLVEFCVFAIDPSFNILKEKISLQSQFTKT